MVYLPSPDSRPSKCSSCTYLKMVISPCQDIFFCDVVMTRLWCHTNKGEVRVRCRSPVVETILFRKKKKKKRDKALCTWKIPMGSSMSDHSPRCQVRVVYFDACSRNIIVSACRLVEMSELSSEVDRAGGCVWIKKLKKTHSSFPIQVN